MIDYLYKKKHGLFTRSCGERKSRTLYRKYSNNSVETNLRFTKKQPILWFSVDKRLFSPNRVKHPNERSDVHTHAATSRTSVEQKIPLRKKPLRVRTKKEDISIEMSPLSFESLLSDSNQRPRDYKSRAAIKPWRIRKELAVWHFPVWWDAFLLVCTAKERFYFDSTKFRRIFLSTFHEKNQLVSFFTAILRTSLRSTSLYFFHAPPPFASPTVN